ncbi:UrcA family protein [Parasphingopyxis algicola]|uniref:UrcA family protein n=1 Tax=Parasphingopyxis algicola TaxID=2026624 RepID=UPI00159F7A3D|nr:UrcA family protein [Parasphingopyxis algicola]QLC25908.1 UrcA family protein [Parasphingopyxis algicola]
MQKIAFAFAAVAMAGAATAFTTSPALAAMAKVETVVIDTRTYDLRSSQGYARLTERIDRASRQVCGTVDVRDIEEAYAIRACQGAAVEDAMEQLNDVARSPSVTVGASR